MNTDRAFILFIVVLSLVYLSSLFLDNDPWWDSAVYVGMGKYIFSSGKVGLWEPARPVIWPLFLGFSWKLGFNPILAGKAAIIMLSIASIALVYLISKKIFEGKTAFIAAVILALFPVFFLFTSILHAEIPSTFFLLLGIYLFTLRRHKEAGFVLGISFLTRFFQIFSVSALFLALLLFIYKKQRSWGDIGRLSLFFSIPVAIYLAINQILYDNAFFPFSLQIFMTFKTGWVFSQPFSFYFANLMEENALALFSLAGIVYVLRKPSSEKLALLLVLLLSFAPYNAVAHKEMRLLIAAIPFISIFAAHGIVQTAELLKKNRAVMYALIGIIFLLIVIPNLRFNTFKDDYDAFYGYVGGIKDAGSLYISNPSFIVHSDKKADELLYYPLYSSEKISWLLEKTSSMDHVLMNTCDILPCHPLDSSCPELHNQFITELKQTKKMHLHQANGNCEFYIFSTE